MGDEGSRGDEVPFGARLTAAVAATGPLCAGIDPSGELLGDWGLADDAGGVRRFALRCVEAFAGVVPIVKPQVAWFERHGAAGMTVLEETIAAAGAAGLLVLADAKRGDFDLTNSAYADAWLRPSSPLAADAVTVHPYLGLGALAPLLQAAVRWGKGVFVVVRSSNPGGRPIQTARTAAGPSVEDSLLGALAERNRGCGAPVGPFGAVVGATLAPSDFPLERLGGPILAPGLGAQGATAADVARLFGRCPPSTVVASASRSVLSAGPDAAALRSAAAAARDDVARSM